MGAKDMSEFFGVERMTTNLAEKLGITIYDPRGDIGALATPKRMDGVEAPVPYELRDDYKTPLERAYGVLLNMEPPPAHTHRVFVIREVSTEIKFTPRDGETEHDAFLRVCEERGITGVIRHSEPRKI